MSDNDVIMDPEVHALHLLQMALAPLDSEQQERILTFSLDRVRRRKFKRSEDETRLLEDLVGLQQSFLKEREALRSLLREHMIGNKQLRNADKALYEALGLEWTDAQEVGSQI